MIAKNNIFNIRVGKQPWFGQTGEKKGFAEFETREHAIRAWLVLMRTYRRRYQRYTIRDIVGRFAPHSNCRRTTAASASPWRGWKRPRK